MAKSKGNVVTHGLSGKIGDMLVFRQVNGQTIVSKIPEQSKFVSEKQLAQRLIFQQAVFYGRTVIIAPETKDLYATAAKKEKGKSAFNIAVADYCNAPNIDNVDLSEYTGNAGDKIRIIASDNFVVKSVNVRITNADGSLVEEGEAVQNLGNTWIFTATQVNENLEGDKIVVSASDLPGNVAQENFEL
jgi:hypothetical protein